jgi:RNA polymerase sigma factor (sigma-70 family)
LFKSLITEEIQNKRKVQSMDQQKVNSICADTTTDEELVRRCKQNERGAQKILYERFFGKMMAIVRRYIRNQEDAMEVLNTSFLKVFHKMDSYKGSGSLGAWISKIMMHSSLDYLRSNKKYTDQIVLDEKFELKYDKEFDTEEYENLDMESLYRLIDKLPFTTKIVFNMFAIDGFSHKEISKELNISVGTSKWHVSMARQRLIAMLMLENTKY